jgi:hypothetical protein
MDFENTPIGMDLGYATLTSAGGAAPSPLVAVADGGSPYGHVMEMSVDSSQCSEAWEVQWIQELMAPWVTVSNADSYDPSGTFLRFDIWASSTRPVHIKLYYNSQTSFSDTRNLEIDVTPTTAGSFQTYKVPISQFSITWLTGNPPNAPTSMSFSVKGDPANPASSWPCTSNNVVMLDNIAYAIAPPLSIAVSNDGAVISWATNSAGFALQASPNVTGSVWTNVSSGPTVVGDQNQLRIAPASNKSFYRLICP